MKLLFLHGAGTSDKDRVNYLIETLRPLGVEGFTFNFSGHGENKIPVEKSGLQKRVAEAESAIKKFKLAEPLHIVGSSMGGYIAVKLLEKYRVANLILFAPAFYDTRAYSTPFDQRFTQIIRQKNSWQSSDAFLLLKKFSGNVLVFIGKDDPVIPKDLISKLEENLLRAKTKEIIRIPNCTHAIHKFISEHEKWKTFVAEKISQLSTL